MESESSRLEEEARKRRERLKNLKRKVEDNHDSETTSEIEQLPKPIFRNYMPSDEELRLNQLPRAKPESVENEIKSHLEAAKPEPLVQEIDLTSLAPRKPDWDLNRDAAKKLEKLERRTQKAIAELIRERIKSNEDALADVVNSYNENVEAENSDDED